MNNEKVIEDQVEEIKELKVLLRRANVFYEDVISQIGGLCIQDYANMNELGIGLSKLSAETEVPSPNSAAADGKYTDTNWYAKQ